MDLQQLHVWAEDWVEEDEWYEALVRLREQGKVRFFGVSLNSHQPDTGVRLAESGRIDALQVIHNIFEQAPEDRLFPAVQKHNVGILARVPFDESSLTGKLTKSSTFARDDFRSSYFAGPRLAETVERVEGLRWLVPDHAASMPEAALRYCLSHPAVSTVIPGIRNPWQAEQNCAAADAGPLGAPSARTPEGAPVGQEGIELGSWRAGELGSWGAGELGSWGEIEPASREKRDQPTQDTKHQTLNTRERARGTPVARVLLPARQRSRGELPTNRDEGIPDKPELRPRRGHDVPPPSFWRAQRVQNQGCVT